MHFFRRTFLGLSSAEMTQVFAASERHALTSETVDQLTSALAEADVGEASSAGSASPGRPSRSASKPMRAAADVRLTSALRKWRETRKTIAAELRESLSAHSFAAVNNVYFAWFVWAPLCLALNLRDCSLTTTLLTDLSLSRSATHPMFDDDAAVSSEDAALPLSPTLFLPAEWDVLRDESPLMAARMRVWQQRARRVALSCPLAPTHALVQTHLMPRVPHGVLSTMPGAPEWTTAVNAIAAFVRAHTL